MDGVRPTQISITVSTLPILPPWIPSRRVILRHGGWLELMVKLFASQQKMTWAPVDLVIRLLVLDAFTLKAEVACRIVARIQLLMLALMILQSGRGKAKNV
ncbi:hypothetical protein CFOL_v3_35555 [Cephalotus follicularis]|uniref:Uncharacterized protein n=1 Tax=Cephalotus follicularis TaxID=3775 RepID=A0A1Q3DI65_CEPFO|nr:hypothetical protein CFOL_v3_35555 [Cephalotus follicularis]